MAQQNDQVFQLSLTEIAFTITFLLLLLLGYLVFKEQTERLAAEAKLEKVQVGACLGPCATRVDADGCCAGRDPPLRCWR